MMYISQIKLKNWKSYKEALFDFPEPSSEQKIVLIGAKNGYGKTSLFEAIILGLFGKHGMSNIQLSAFSDSTSKKESYKKFLERALHKESIFSSTGYSCSVSLTFIDNGNPIEIKRIWRFNQSRDFMQHDEEIQIYHSQHKKPVDIQVSESVKRLDEYQAYITQMLLPSHLANFFLFDGEQVSELASREHAELVKKCIEGLLGIPILNTLKKDLSKYAYDKGYSLKDPDNKKIDELVQKRNSLEDRYNEAKQNIEKYKICLKEKQIKQAHLIREITALGGMSKADSEQKLKEINNYDGKIKSCKEQLQDFLQKEVAIALAGSNLHTQVIKTLESEIKREQWDSGKKQGNQNLQKFLSAIDKNIGTIIPQLQDIQHKAVINKVEKAWQELWMPPLPPDCAEEYRHKYLSMAERSKIIEQIESISKFGAKTVVNLLDDIDDNERRWHRLNDEINKTEAITPSAEKKIRRNQELLEEIQNLNRKIGGIDNQIKALDAELPKTNAELGRAQQAQAIAERPRRLKSRAEEICNLIDHIIQQTVPIQIKAVAKTMTEAYQAIAHKKDMVERIEIDESCNVQLLNADGINIREHNLSAGERQIFMQSLIAAVASVSNRAFPMVVDTPLGRLDDEHRKGILRHLASRNGQVILLSTNTEIVGEYLQEIKQHIQKTYRITSESIGNGSHSVVHEGYFENFYVG